MKTLIKNIGLMVSGDIAKPLLDGDSILIVDGKIAAVDALKVLQRGIGLNITLTCPGNASASEEAGD